MKVFFLALAVLMAGGLEQSDEPSTPPNSSSEKAKQEGLKTQKNEKSPPHLLLKRVSSGDINPKTVSDGFEEEGEGHSPKKLLAVNGKVSLPRKILRKKSTFNLRSKIK